MIKKIKEVFNKFLSLKMSLKVRILSIFVVIILLCFSVVSYILTYSDVIIDFKTDADYLESGIYDNNVLVNDLESDLYYYEGLNYVTSENSSTPTSENKNIYNESNLVQTKIIYLSNNDINNKKGYVSLTERQDRYTYFKVFPVDTNETPSLDDDFVLIELIDNPFLDRPTDSAFNAWVTDYVGAYLSYDSNYHLRYAKVPVTYTNSKPDSITITFTSSFTNANVGMVNTSSSWDNAFNSLETAGMKRMEITENIYGELDMAGYYHQVTITRNQSCSGYYSSSGELQNNCTCRNTRCTYYEMIENEVFDSSRSYYYLNNYGRMALLNNDTVELPIVDVLIIEEFRNSNMSGFYEPISFSRGQNVSGYYDINGNLLSGTCTSTTCNYYKYIQYYDENGNPNIADINKTYYYLVTRDTNIIVMTSNITNTWDDGNTKPFTLTGIHNGTDYNTRWRTRNVQCYADTAIENLQLYYNYAITSTYTPNSTTAEGVLVGNFYNVKIGRGIKQYSNYPSFRAALAGNGSRTGSNNDPTKYRFQVESGIYNSISLTNRSGASSTTNLFIKNKSVYGNDYDRVNEDNDNLDVYFCASGSWSSSVYATTNSTDSDDISIDLVVKSGEFGSSKYDSATGIYVGGRSGGNFYSSRRIKIEGGKAYNVNGGPLSRTQREGVNDIFIHMTGGEVDAIFGGAATTATYGNRIISVTGGKVNHNVFGGSNGYDGGNGDGTLVSDSYIYIGGNGEIGDPDIVEANRTLYGAEPGSVFGIGNGRNGYETIGSTDNSTIIIDKEATIRGNIYGGGNYGATGSSSNKNTTSTKIIMHDGLVEGSIYGGGNNNGSGAAGITSTISVYMDGGNVLGSIYGGSNQEGVVYGSVDVKVVGGEIANSIYGGGEGGYFDSDEPGTFVRDGVNVTIGDSDSSLVPIINGSVYGGSAYGTVNGATRTTNISSYPTNVVVNKGLITNVFGGGEGSNSYTPYVEGDITVTINDGTITNVYGGNDASGKPNGNITVYINGGTISNTFGGGEQTDANTTNVYLNGGTSNYIYGGSNQSGEVGTTNVITSGGKCLAVYGGNNQGGTTNTTNVTINGGDITDVYGGGERTSVLTSTNVNLNNVVSNLYGGSNLEGNVPTSNIVVTNGTATNLFGGNNQGGTTTTSNILVDGSNITNLYGGGLKASTTTSNININYGYIKNLYGGGSEAGVTTTNVKLGTPLIENVFGGSNILGDVTTSNISNLAKTSMSNIDVSASYTLSYQNQSGATGITSSEQIDVSITNNTGAQIVTWDLYIITSDGLFDSNWSSANVSGKNGTYLIDEINQYYGTNSLANGGTFTFNFNVHAYVPLEDFKIYGYVFVGYDANGNKYTATSYDELRVYNMYGGNNEGGTTKTTNIDLTSGNIDVLYGGGNQAVTTDTNVTVKDTLINNAVYGGGNQATVDTVKLSLENSIIGSEESLGSVYGGGNQAAVNKDITLTVSNQTNLYGNLYAGGNLGNVLGTVTTTITDSNITEDIYGGGNQASLGNKTDDTIVSNLTLTNVEVKNIYGGGNSAGINGSTNVTINGSNIIENVYGAGNGVNSIVTGDTTGELNPAIVTGNTNLVITNNTTVGNSIYGGGNLGFVNGNTNVRIDTVKINENIYGGGNAAQVLGNTNLNITDGKIFKNVYAAGNGINAIVSGNTALTIKNSLVNDSVYGGGNAAKVLGNTNSLITNVTVFKSIYAGGNGQTAQVSGNTNLNIDGKTNVSKHVFGGGNAAPTGTLENNNSNSVVNIAGANIGGNVYGGANTSVLYGETTLNIGYDVVSVPGLVKDDIIIGGTVFGGGEANEEGSEVIDFSFISVTKGITINIDGNDHDEFTINGSIFGSGNASMTEGYSNVYISNYGSSDDIKKNISLQRADLFELKNTYIELSGATDRTNEYSDVLFTLSRIDELKLLNNTSLYLQTGANLVKKFTSGLLNDGAFTLASVDIDSENKTVTKNVDNRLYMYEGKNLNVATNQNVTLYGEVNGMTFLGMYLHNQNDEPITAMYDVKYDYGEQAASGDLYFFTSGSYVLGSHKANHDIEVDGFYSNFANKDVENEIEVKYIDPTPEDSDFYMWVIGEQVISYDIHLTASKYSTLGIEEFSFLNFAKSNTKFTILGFNYAGLERGVELVASDDIPRIASSGEVADNVMGLAIKSGQSGWITIGETEFLSNETNPIIGTTNYESENSTTVPSFVFYLYHSKNLKTAGQMGTVTISLVAITPIDDLTNEVERINFNVELSRALYTADEYEASMTPGKQYEMFAPSPVNLTNDSSLSAYYALFMEKETNPYKTGYHRSLTSNYILPVNTKITMIDFSNEGLPVYYYYVVSESDYEAAVQEFSQQNEVSYLLSKFIKMGSISEDNNYDDSLANQLYYNEDTNIAEEEFIFIVDFKESNITEDVLNASLLLELRNADSQTLISVLGIEQETMIYNLYYDKHAVIKLASPEQNLTFYNGNNMNFNINTNFIQQTIGTNTIYDTNYYEQKLGIKLSIYDKKNETYLTGTSLIGVYYEYNGIKYYPRYDGTTRINIAPKIANVSSKITINGEKSNLAGGDYTIVIESFGSPDGIYYGLESSDTITLNFHVMDTLYGLKMSMNEKNYFWNKETGKNLMNSNTLNLNVKYESGLSNPNLRMKLYRRSYDSIYSNNYVAVDLLDYFTNRYTQTSNEFEYYLSTKPGSNVDYFLYMKDNLVSGTYKLEISLYDDNTYVGSVFQYIIIK